MKKCYCIYKYTKGPQNTETDETDSDSNRQHRQNNFFFFFDWGYMCGHQNTKT